jgi:hypothetical protein
MIHALMKDPMQFSAGKYYLTATEPEGRYFEFSWVDNEKSSTRAAQGHNVVRNDGFTRISTDYDLGFVAGAFVELDDGNLYIIEQIAKAISTTAYQALNVSRDPQRDTILALRLVKNVREGAL